MKRNNGKMNWKRKEFKWKEMWWNKIYSFHFHVFPLMLFSRSVHFPWFGREVKKWTKGNRRSYMNLPRKIARILFFENWHVQQIRKISFWRKKKQKLRGGSTAKQRLQPHPDISPIQLGPIYIPKLIIDWFGVFPTKHLKQ